MLYQIGTKKEILPLTDKLPECVVKELLRCTAVLDEEYGENRNYLESGGYSLFAETTQDISAIRAVINFEAHPCEWISPLDSDKTYMSVLYLLNDDFSVVVLIPTAITPDSILKELEE